jgi:hypothetical protein
MKKFFIIILLCLAFILSSCANDTQNESDSTPLTFGSFTQEDLVFAIEGNNFALDTDIAPLIEILGDDYTLSSAPSCVYDGEDKTYDYGNIIIYTYPNGEKDIIWEIDIVGSEYPTAKGIKVGDSLEDINAAYGDSGFDVGHTYIYNISENEDDIESPQLCFEFDEDKISSIIFYSPSNLT